jgi:hypothetical protein
MGFSSCLISTSSAMLCRILRWTDAFTWFCDDTSSLENLKKYKKKMKKIEEKKWETERRNEGLLFEHFRKIKE